jgi:AcrR family transcriptional regulator
MPVRVVGGDRVRPVPPVPLDLTEVLGAVAALSDEDRRLLDAARALIVTHGFRRTLIDDIARRAGVTRRTVNRRLGDKNRIVRTVVAREVETFFTQTLAGLIGVGSPAERTVEAFVTGVVAFHQNEVAQAVLRHEPETLLAFTGKWSEDPMAAVRDLVALGLLGPGLDMDEARRMTELILRITGSLLVAPTSILPLRTEADARWFAKTVFVPIIEGGLPRPEHQ